MESFIAQIKSAALAGYVQLAATGTGADLSLFNNMVDLFSKGIVALGGIYCVIGLLSIARGYKDHAGADMNTGVNQLVSGGLFLLAATFVKSITLS